MMRIQIYSALIAGLLTGIFLVMPLQAEELTGIGVGAKVGTLGIGGEVFGRINNNLNMRLGLQGFNYDYDDSYSDIEYDADLELFSGMLLADWFPFGNNFRLSAGAMLNENELTVTGKPTSGTYNINGVTYPAALVGSLTGDVDFNTVAPYVGIGYGGAFSDTSNWSFFCDVGVLFQGAPNVSYSATGPLAGNPIFQANLEQERKELEDDIDGFEYYPVVSFGVAYKF